MQLALTNPEEDFDAQAAIWNDTRNRSRNPAQALECPAVPGK
jgi:hypothetical protein